MNDKQAELEFRRGYYLATANIMRTHGQDVIAMDVLRQYGNVNFSGIDPMEVKILKPLAREIRRQKENGLSR